MTATTENKKITKKIVQDSGRRWCTSHMGNGATQDEAGNPIGGWIKAGRAERWCCKGCLERNGKKPIRV